MHHWISAPAIPSPSPTPHCTRSSDLCEWVFEHTDNAWLASGSYYLLVKPAEILLIILVAIIARYLVRRTINRLVRSTVDGKAPAILKPLKERRLPGVAPERRRQRAAAIGSVLGSFATASISSVAVLLILSKLGFNLAPLLASAGIVGIALGFGAQTLVKDLIAGLFMLLEDQYGVGDAVDVGQASGTVEAVGLRITTVRDSRGVLWYIRNGEIVRVGNKSQGWSVVVVDVPVGLTELDSATAALREAADSLRKDTQWHDHLIEPPEVLGIEELGPDRVVLRTSVKTRPEARGAVARELRRRLSEALRNLGLAGAAKAAATTEQPITAEQPDQAKAAASQERPDQAGQPSTGTPTIATPSPNGSAKTDVGSPLPTDGSPGRTPEPRQSSRRHRGAVDPA